MCPTCIGHFLSNFKIINMPLRHTLGPSAVIRQFDLDSRGVVAGGLPLLPNMLPAIHRFISWLLMSKLPTAFLRAGSSIFLRWELLILCQKS